MSTKAPIILLGTHRSGTTWIGDILRGLPELAFYHEPRHVWTWGNSRRPDDVLTEEHATPKVVRHIRETFDRYVREKGGTRLAEKTPSNCLRVRFIRAVYPDARFIFLVRDGRSVLESTRRMLREGVPTYRVWKRARQTPLSEWPAQIPKAISTLARRMTGRPLRYWGPRPPGWRDWIRAGDPVPVVLAKQWSATVLRAHRDLASLGSRHAMFLRYEQLLRDPRATAQRLIWFAQLEDADRFMKDLLVTINPSRADSWRGTVSDETLALIRPYMEPALEELGYKW